ncbi:MAG: ATP synthase F1 subunit epsilon [Firmicutes bacterium]|nr:ATP synthase F1 subunit epsilon [Bacillota bacterium]
MSTFELSVIATNRTFYKGICRQVVVSSTDGLLGIMANHERAVVAIVEGETRIQLEDGEWITAVTGIGYVQIQDNKVLIIVDFAEKPEEVDERMAQQALEEAQEEMRQKQSLMEFHISQAKMARAMARLSVKKKYSGF